MRGDLRVTIGGLDFLGQGGKGFVISPDGFSGWDDGVDMRLENTGRPQAHGSFDLPGFQDARTVSISGNAFAEDPWHLGQMRNRLTGLLAGGGVGRILVERSGDVQWADGRLAAKTRFTERGGYDYATFQIQLWCPDPRKFGESRSFTVTTTTPATVFHRGNYGATPKFTITGSMPGGYTIGLNGWDYRVTVPLVSGTPHVIDYNDGHLRINGTIRQNSLGNTNVTTVPPGPGVGFGLYPVTTGTGTAVMELPDTFI